MLLAMIRNRSKMMTTLLLSWLSPLIPQSRTTQAILIGGMVAVVVYTFNRKRYKYPPGPTGLPLIGSLLALRNATLYKKLDDWMKDYGEVLTVDFGPMRAVFLNSLDVVQEAFIKKAVDFAGRPQFYSMQAVTEGGKDIAFTDYGPTWQLHRRLAVKALASYMKGNRLENTLDIVLTKVFDEMSSEKQAFDIQPYIDNIVFNILSKICFDECFQQDEQAKQFLSLIDKANKEVGNGFLEDIFPPLRLWPTKKFRTLMETTDETMGFIHKRIVAHRDTFSPDVERDLTDAMLNAQRTLAEEENTELLAEITDTHFAQTINDIFRAGVDTSRQTLHWTVLYIAAHPDVQAKMHVELDSVLGSRRVPLMSDRAKLPYTDAVLLECMRISSPAPIGLPHQTTCDTSIGKYTLPKGTTVFANLHAVLLDPKIWEEPLKFNPGRFIDLSGKLKPKPPAWAPFSMGKRACLAESLVKPELLIILAALYRNFEIRMPEGVEPDLRPTDTGLSYIPRPYDVVIKDRFA